MNVVILRGQLSRPPLRRELPSGDVIVQYEVTLAGPERAESVPVAWPSPPAAAEAFDTADAVVVVGRVRRRFFRTAGATQSRTEVVADRVVAMTGTRAARVLRDALARAEEEVDGLATSSSSSAARRG